MSFIQLICCKFIHFFDNKKQDLSACIQFLYLTFNVRKEKIPGPAIWSDHTTLMSILIYKVIFYVVFQDFSVNVYETF